LDQALERSPADGFWGAVIGIVSGLRRFILVSKIKVERRDGKRAALLGQQHPDRQSERHLLQGLPWPQGGRRLEQQFRPAEPSLAHLVPFERPWIEIGRKIRNVRHFLGKRKP